MSYWRNLARTTLVGGFVLLAACTKADPGAADSSQTASTISASPADTGMSGMDHSAMTNTPAKDADQEFVRMMVDHHEGLIALADTALARQPSQAVRAEATKMKEMQGAEQKKMIDMLKSDYGEDKMPMVMSSNAQMIAQVASKTGAALDKTFREQVIAHHEEGLKMISDFESRLTKPAVRSMTTKMKSDQQKEIAELKAKL